MKDRCKLINSVATVATDRVQDFGEAVVILSVFKERMNGGHRSCGIRRERHDEEEREFKLWLIEGKEMIKVLTM